MDTITLDLFEHRYGTGARRVYEEWIRLGSGTR